MSDLAGKTALVTGATAGIGRAVAELLAQGGADVVVHGRDPKRGAEVVDAISAAGGTARFITADLSDAEDVERMAREAGPARYWATEFGAHGIRVNGVASGPVRTRGSEPLLDATGEAMANTTARRRIGDPIEIAEVVLFLVRSGSSFVNGTIVGAHGGERSVLPS